MAFQPPRMGTLPFNASGGADSFGASWAENETSCHWCFDTGTNGSTIAMLGSKNPRVQVKSCCECWCHKFWKIPNDLQM